MGTVQHSILLPAPAARVYAMYLDPAQHASFTGGGEVTISDREGAEFSGFGGRITGRILRLDPGRLIVQTWRSFEFKPEDPDSILILALRPEGRGTRLSLVQAPTPEHLHDTLQNNWPMRYLDPWKAALGG